MTTVTVSPKFQIVLPKELRESMHIKAGEKFMAWDIGGVIELVRVRPAKAYRGLSKGLSTEVPREKKDRDL
jgi:AbrB family looped-hinge helix DNA binding protein